MSQASQTPEKAQLAKSGEKTGSTFQSLRNPSYRLYFIGQTASMCGTWAQTLAMAWLILDITDSGTNVGTLTATTFLPVLLLSAWAGSVADRFDERQSVMVVQTLLGAQALVLATIVLADVVEVWMLYALAIVQGIGVAFDTPTRQSLVGRIVGNEDLRNALSLNAGLVQIARLVGPAVAGVLIETVGIGMCFLINALSYAIVFVAVYAIRAPKRQRVDPTAPAKGGVREGMVMVWNAPDLRNLLLMALSVGLVAVNFTVALPILVRDRFGDDARTFGALAATYGLGALVGAILTAARTAPTKRLLVTFLFAQSASLVACSQFTRLSMLYPAIALAGLVGLTMGVTLNASLQLGAPTEYRGRIIGLYFLMAFGANVIGAPLIGWIGQAFGAHSSFLYSGGLSFVVCIGFLTLWRRRLDEPIVLLSQTPS